MSNALKTLIDCGTKLWIDSIDPDLVVQAKADGATGATSNPIIVEALLKSGRFDTPLREWMDRGLSDSEVAWQMTDQLVRSAQAVFSDIWEQTNGNDGYVSFELDPLIETEELRLSFEQRVATYLDLGQRWSAGHKNRMIKVPATPAGLVALEPLAAAGIPLNVTLIFSARQYEAAREAILRGAQSRGDLAAFKSVYSIFVSRVDVYADQHCPGLTIAQGLVGIVNSQRIWASNQQYWSSKACPLAQEIVFASTGTKKPEDVAWKYVQALAGSDIQTNPPLTNRLTAGSGINFTRQIDCWPSPAVLAEIDQHVDPAHMEATLLREGLAKFAQPQLDLLTLIAQIRSRLS